MTRDCARSSHDALLRHLDRALQAAPPGPLAVAFSAGPDSTALLHALTALPGARARGLRALHVDHGLHADSGRWAGQAVALCRRLELPCRVMAVTVARDGGLGPEAAARRARYEALASALEAGEILVTAHHREDQAETFLLRALRASGPDGLAAMRPLRPFGRGWLWRPLLDFPRAGLRAWLERHGLDAVEDPGNLEPANDRGWLRRQLMPRLRERWPHAAAALARSAALCAEGSDLLHEQDHRLLDACRGEAADVLRVSALRAQPPARRARLLRAWLEELGLPPPPAQGIARIETDLLPARPDARAEFAWSGLALRRWRDGLYAEVRSPGWPPDWTACWDGRTPLELPTGERLRLVSRAPAPEPGGTAGQDHPPPAFDPPLTVCARRGGERIRLPGRDHRHRLKHALQTTGVPPWRRDRMPLLFATDGELLAAGDRLVSARMQTWLDHHGLALRLSR